MSIQFPRDENGEIKRKKGCQTPGCNHPNYHVCLVGKPDTTEEVLKAQQERKTRPTTISPQHNQSLQDGRDARWERYREENQERDAEIVRRYQEEEIGMSKLAKDVGLAYTTVRKILVTAKVHIRERGNNVQHRNRFPTQRAG